MINTFSHTFTHQTQNNNKIRYNVITIVEEDQKKHFIQYVRYEKINDKTIKLRQVSIKVGRAYYLEIANINLINSERRRYVFSILGKRRFGANNKHFDIYLLSEIDEKVLHAKYVAHYEGLEFEPCFTHRTDYSTNKYRLFSLKIDGKNIAFLDQVNITQRKRLHKIFCIELYDDELKIFNQINNSKRKVNYLFNKIGKIFFKTLDKKELSLTKNLTDLTSLACSVFQDSSSEREHSSRLNDNLLFRRLQDISQENRVDLLIYKHCIEMLNTPQSEDAITLLNDAIDLFTTHTKSLTQLNEISNYFIELKELIASNSIAYLLEKKDSDLQDIFLYMLESFTQWNNYLFSEDGDVRAFNHATLDFTDSLRHLVESSYMFKHEYTCNDAKI